MRRRPAAAPSGPPLPRGLLRRPLRVRLARVLVVLLGGLLAVTAPAPAVAHDALTGSTPADGATVATPPAGVELTFTGPPLTLGAEVRVTGPDGRVVDEGEVVVAGTTVSQPLAGDLPPGTYAVAWRVTSADGHPLTGELTYIVTGGTGGATASPEPAAPTGTAEPAPTPGTADPDRGAVPWFLAGAVLLAAAAAAWWARRRRGLP